MTDESKDKSTGCQCECHTNGSDFGTRSCCNDNFILNEDDGPITVRSVSRDTNPPSSEI